MFDANSRLELEEALGYEKYVLAAACEAIRKERGSGSSPAVITIPDDGRTVLGLQFESNLGDTGTGMTRHMSPLVFVAAYKLLDMLVEWTLRENQVSFRFPFSDKLRAITTTPNLVFPDLLENDPQLREVVIGLYGGALPMRNAIIHNKWGTNTEGNLNFDFVHSTHRTQIIIHLEVVLALAEAMSLIGELLVGGYHDQLKLLTLKWLLDKCQQLHEKSQFDIGQPRYFRVIRQTATPGAGPVHVDLGRIRQVVAKQALNDPAIFDLRVEATSPSGLQVWEIPAESLPAGDEMILDQ